MLSILAHMSICTICKIQLSPENAYNKAASKKGKLYARCKKCFTRYCVERWIKRKESAILQMGNKCADCLQSFPYQVYDFHHLDPNQKDMSWDKMRQVSPERLSIELAKCVLLCANCHRIRHISMCRTNDIGDE